MRLRRQDGAREHCLARRICLLEIPEEKELVADKRAAVIGAPLMLTQLRFRSSARLVDKPLRVEPFVLDRVEELTAESVRAALGRELDLDGSFGAGLRRQPCR